MEQTTKNTDQSIIDELKGKNRALKEQLKLYHNLFKITVSKLSEAVVVVDSSRKIAFTNSHFTSLLSDKFTEMMRRGAVIEGMEMREFLNNEIYRMLISVQNSGKDLHWIETKICDHPVLLSIYSVKRGDSTLLVIRDMRKSDVVNDQIVEQLNAVISQNMAMVQKIGFLLGEEISQTTQILNKTVKSILANGEEQQK